jgi:hypothetical protein
MGLTATYKKGDYPICPEGNHLAICFMIVDLGTQTDRFGSARKIAIGWELSDELNEKGEPFRQTHFYTLSLNEKSNLRKHLITWRGRDFTEDELKGFDLKNLLGKPCLLSIVHSSSEDGSKTYSNVYTVSKLLKGMELPQQQNPILYFSLEEPFNADKFSLLPKNYKEKIMKSPEYLDIMNIGKPEPVINEDYEENDGDVPF